MRKRPETETVAVTRTKLCIGGPHDGKRVASEFSAFNVQVMQPPSVGEMSTDRPALMQVRYVELTIGNSEGHVSFWTVEGMTMQDVLLKLADGYWQRRRG